MVIFKFLNSNPVVGEDGGVPRSSGSFSSTLEPFPEGPSTEIRTIRGQAGHTVTTTYRSEKSSVCWYEDP